MKHDEFHKVLNTSRIKFAILEAERKTSGEIRIMVTKRSLDDPMKMAQKIFIRERMDRTQERNGVLILIAPRSRNYAVIGDSGITEKVGIPFWDEVVKSIGNYFKNDDYTWGLVEAVNRIGEALSTHFPHRDDDRNELSDDILGD